jgi:hypothetical protein
MPSNELKVGQRVFWIDEQFLREELRAAVVTEVRYSERWREDFILTNPPRRVHQPDVAHRAAMFFTTAADAWRALAADRRQSAKDHQALADEYERRAQEAEAKAA